MRLLVIVAPLRLTQWILARWASAAAVPAARLGASLSYGQYG